MSGCPIVDLRHSPYARLRPVGVEAVTLTDQFWQPRREINRTHTLPQQLRQCEETGRLDNFRRAAGKSDGPFQGIVFNDSDVYKWLEAAAFSLATHPDPILDADVDRVIALLADAQGEDGYLNTYFTFDKADLRWTNLRDWHELYCAGHLFQAAVAHFRATGKRSLLDVATRYADYIITVFGPEGRPGACGHPEIELALVELARTTGEAKYLDMAARFIDLRGQQPSVIDGHNQFDRRYMQDHVPFRQLDEVTGHAVRMLYLSAGATDVLLENGDAGLQTALDAQWDNMTQKRMYVTGGVGPRWEGEAFGADYELPNERAYAETCAAIASVMWNWRMLHLTGEAKYADVLETALYNGVLAGLSLEGTHYYYQNPLADRGKHRRQAWFGCACCPPNIARTLAQLPGYFYSTGTEEDGTPALWTHLFADSRATITLPDGGQVRIRQEAHYPWSGNIILHVEEAPVAPFALHVRVPQWAGQDCFARFWGAETRPPDLVVSGVPMYIRADYEAEPGGYIAIRQAWQAGDRVSLVFPMQVERVESHPHVTSNRDRIALRRGPLIYCIEQADFADAGVDVWDVSLPDDTILTPEDHPDLPGVASLVGEARAFDSAEWEGALYAPHGRPDPDDARPIPFRALPYYAWANRQPGPMQVWIPTLPVS